MSKVLPRVLPVASQLPVGADDDLDGLVEPAIGAFAVQQERAVLVQLGLVLRIIVIRVVVQDQNEGRSLDHVQGGSVRAPLEELVPGLSPGRPVGRRHDTKMLLTLIRFDGVIKDGLDLLLDLGRIKQAAFVVAWQPVEPALVHHGHVGGVLEVDEAVRLHPGDPGGVEEPLVLVGAHGDQALQDDRRGLLLQDQPAELERQVDDVAGPGGLDPGRGLGDDVDAVEVAVDHEGRPTPEINILFPPIAHVVVGPPPFQLEPSLQRVSDCVLKFGAQLGELLVLFLAIQRFDAVEVPAECVFNRGQGHCRQRTLVGVQQGLARGLHGAHPPQARHELDGHRPGPEGERRPLHLVPGHEHPSLI